MPTKRLFLSLTITRAPPKGDEYSSCTQHHRRPQATRTVSSRAEHTCTQWPWATHAMNTGHGKLQLALRRLSHGVGQLQVEHRAVQRRCIAGFGWTHNRRLRQSHKHTRTASMSPPPPAEPPAHKPGQATYLRRHHLCVVRQLGSGGHGDVFKNGTNIRSYDTGRTVHEQLRNQARISIRPASYNASNASNSYRAVLGSCTTELHAQRHAACGLHAPVLGDGHLQRAVGHNGHAEHVLLRRAHSDVAARGRGAHVRGHDTATTPPGTNNGAGTHCSLFVCFWLVWSTTCS